MTHQKSTWPRLSDLIDLTNVHARPMGLAASILYLSSIKTGEVVSQMSVARAAGVTEVTVRNRFKDLKSKPQLD